MKKLLLVVGVGAFLSFGLNSCSKCAECSGAGTGIDGIEYCKGGTFEDLAYDLAKESCEAAGGEFK